MLRNKIQEPLILALLNCLVFVSTASALPASSENDASQSLTSSTSAARIEKEPGGEIEAGMTVEDLIMLQCLCKSSMDEPVADLISNKLSAAYIHYVVAERTVHQGLEDYLDLCDMKSDAGNQEYCALPGGISYTIRKAQRDIASMMNDIILYRLSLVKMTSEEAVDELDYKHGWSNLDDKQALEGKSQRPRHPEPTEPMFKDTRTKSSTYDGQLYH